MLSTLENLVKLARERKSVPVEGSYTNKLLTDKDGNITSHILVMLQNAVKFKNNNTIAIWRCSVVRSAGSVIQHTYTTSPTPRPSGDVRARKTLSTHLYVRCFHTLHRTFKKFLLLQNMA